MNQQLQAQLAQILQAMQGAAQEYGPKALDLAVEVRRWDAIGQLACGLALLVFLLVGIPLAFRLYRREMANFEAVKAADMDTKGWCTREPIAPILIAVVSVLAAGLGIGFALSSLANIWNWIGAFRPELALAHDILVKATGQ